MKYVIAYDIGTTGLKTCIFKIDKTIDLISSDNNPYNLYILDNGGAEQDADEWWRALCQSTKECFAKAKEKVEEMLQKIKDRYSKTNENENHNKNDGDNDNEDEKSD